ncbi:dihydroxyacetone kinase operon transcriptional regulator DhaR [Martelella alba]|uniref:PTS-dependent dihydroxyacetone kinase operon transcriptional regulator DhaR n=1 Tax=Martelella alba TaxID=2590451 RepID=A0ABY2SN31_9HYPH|nr:dihydroxyacetone kinase operon transcriptional regulator DhaR [Martelella alba]TKI07297.1 PTS-dependent dihydroxyacetone kinase operon transcriptional regulator DhaR [Martelella alba]
MSDKGAPPAPDNRDAVLAAAWRRSETRLRPDIWRMPPRASGMTFQSLCQRQRDVLVLAQATLEDAWEYMAPRPCVLQIMNASGCVLWQCGAVEVTERLAVLGILPGCYWSEDYLGANAPALAIHTAAPVRLSGGQHFKAALHPWHCCATPVFDSTGRLQAAIALIAPAGQQADADLALTLALAREVGDVLHTDSLLAENNRHLNALYALLEGVEDGVLAWDRQQRVQYLNQHAADMLALDGVASVGKRLDELLILPALVQNAMRQHTPLSRVEVTFETLRQAFLPLQLTLKPVQDGDHYGFIALLHPIAQLRQLIHLQSVRQARTFETMPAGSADMRRLLRYGRRAAQDDHAMLLCGEGGVGKMALAQAIHAASDRRDGPWLAVDLQTVTLRDMARELLGCDASEGDAGQPGKFELANGGTLYLEHIEYLSPELQSSLLQMLKTGRIMRQNSSRILPANVRLIAASAANLPQLVQAGRFRRQLFYTLRSFAIEIPPLRRRPADIPALVDHHLRLLETHYHRKYQIDQEALAQLTRYRWPGNDEELEGMIERAAMVCRQQRIRLADLPEHLAAEASGPEDSTTPSSAFSLAETERQAILRAARAGQGQPQAIARLLGIGRTTLWRKLRLYGIDLTQFRQ